MARIAELPPELVLHIVSFLTREIHLDPMRRRRLGYYIDPANPELVPDLPSINALSCTNSVFHQTLNRTLYEICASVEFLGRRALLFAVEHNSEVGFDKLVAAGVSVDGKFESKVSFLAPNPFGLLQIAAGKGSSLIVPKLLRMYGSEMLERVYARDDWHLSALDCAVLEGRMETVRLLAPMAILAPSSSSPIVVDVSDERIQTHKQYLGEALVISGIRRPSGENIAICEYLLSEGVNTRDRGSWTSLACATTSDSLATMQVLLAAGADPNFGNRDGVVPLFRAGNVPAAQALLNAGARIYATDNTGRNALTYRALEHAEVLRFFLERGVDANQADDDGRTPLHYACEKNAAVVVAIELLLQFGATTVEKADADGVTPVDEAMHKGKIEVVRLLEPLIQDPALKSKIAKWLEEKGAPEDTRQLFERASTAHSELLR
ncbi:ankyrin repeat-containing domain protein [Mycena sanguinolenta]|nr:ankyrin repeat-containing domain protein [Mycena sanguinolenta]